VIRPVDIWDSAADLWDRVKPRGKTSKVDRIPGVETTPTTLGTPELAAKHAELARQLAELQWDLGGLVYEMAIRDHFRLDVVVQRAAALQAVDAELGAVERMMRMEDAGAAGTCPSCGALYSRGAVFCWQCGHDLMARSQVTTDSGVAAAPAGAAAPAPPTAPAGTSPPDRQRPPVVPPDPVPPAMPAPDPATEVMAPPAGTRWPGQD
jgi:hypothetical protein